MVSHVTHMSPVEPISFNATVSPTLKTAFIDQHAALLVKNDLVLEQKNATLVNLHSANPAYYGRQRAHFLCVRSESSAAIGRAGGGALRAQRLAECTANIGLPFFPLSPSPTPSFPAPPAAKILHRKGISAETSLFACGAAQPQVIGLFSGGHL